ncbi:MAG: hypothetical protein EZS28_044657, partial [Streblomastix strix]
DNEFGLQEVSLGIGGNETALIENKTIMISDDTNGYDQIFKGGVAHLKTTTKDIPYSTGPRGVVQIDLAVKDIQILNCQFENIIIDSLEGSALRIENFTDTPPIIPPLILPLPLPEPDTSINITINSTSFKDIQSSGDISNRGGASIYGEIGDNGSLIIEDTSFTSCSYIENDGGYIYVILNKTGRFETKGTIIFTGCRTTKDALEVVGCRGGALYIYLAEESTINFIIGEDSSFTTNEADICGEDIFIYSRNINILNIRTHILFDITTFTNSDNAMYGTEYKLIDELYHIPIIDYNILERYIYYPNDRMYISIRK